MPGKISAPSKTRGSGRALRTVAGVPQRGDRSCAGNGLEMSALPHVLPGAFAAIPCALRLKMPD